MILWPDTFNDHFHPQVLQAGADVLEAAGFEVVLPPEVLCCGRPLYDWGMLGQARSLLNRTLRVLREEIRAGTPVVGLEPSCVSVFRDELPSMLRGREDARRLASQTYLLTELLRERAPDFQVPALSGSAVVHGHCHHKSVLRWDDERELLAGTGLRLQEPESGCCGMAGAFGFERGEHYEVSVAAGERVLLPAVRDADPDELIVTGGFSCREQIQQQTGRTVLHPAEVLAMALREGAAASPSPERNGARP